MHLRRTVIRHALDLTNDAGSASERTRPCRSRRHRGEDRGRGHLYQLTAAGEDLRPVIEMLSVCGQRWVQGRFGPDDLDPALLMLGMQRQIDPAETPDCRSVRVARPPEALPRQGILVVCDPASRSRCLPQGSRVRCGCDHPGRPSRVHQALTRLYRPRRSRGPRQGRFHGNDIAIALLCRLMRLPDRPGLKQFRFAPFPADREARDMARTTAVV